MKPWSRKLVEQIADWFAKGNTVNIDGVDTIPINGQTGLVVASPAHFSTTNSSIETLVEDGIFIGEAEDITNYAIVMLTVYSDVASATDGLCIQFSNDGINWYWEDCYTIGAGEAKVFSVQCMTKYIRVKYTNGPAAQGAFELSLKHCPENAKASSHRIADAISSQDDAELIKAVLTALQPNGTFVNIGSTSSGNLKVSDAESPLAIAMGLVLGAAGENKWGSAPDFDADDDTIDVWDGAEDGAAFEAMQYTFSDTNDIDTVSSTSTADVGLDVTIEGLRSGVPVTETVELNGQNKVNFTAMNAINRMYNSNGTLFTGHVMAYVNTPIGDVAAGVPTDTSKIRSLIHPDEQQTEQAIYTVPTGKTAYVFAGYASTAGANKSSNYIIKLLAQEPSGVFRTKQKMSISDNGSSYVSFNYPIPQKFIGGTRIKVTARMTSTGATGGSVSAGFSLVLIDD